MLGQLQEGDLRIITNAGIVGTVTPGTSVPQAGTTNNYGTDTVLISSGNNTQDSWGIEISVIETAYSATTTGGQGTMDFLLDADTEDVFIKALIIGGAYASSVRHYFFPVHIPAGKAISARCAHVETGTIAPRAIVSLYGGSPPPLRVGRKITTYGTQATNARGLAVTPSQSGAAGSITQMTASTTEDHFAFSPGLQISGDPTMQARTYNVGIGVGASTEQRIGNWWFFASAAEHQTGPYPVMPSYFRAPSGSRLTLLVSNSGTNDAGYDGLIYALS